MTTRGNRFRQAQVQINSILKEVALLNRELELRYERLTRIKEEYKDVLGEEKSGGE